MTSFQNNLIDIKDIIFEFNLLLTKFFNLMEFCQHDSDYRPVRGNHSLAFRIKNDICEFVKIYPSIVDKVFLYGTDNYKLTEYAYRSHIKKDVYAFKGFLCMNREEFFDYGKKKDISQDIMQKFIIESNKKKSCCKLPYTIEIYENDNSYGVYPERFSFSSFQFIDVISLRLYIDSQV